MDLGMRTRISPVPSFAKGLHVMVVDNETTSLLYIASLLEQYSYEVTTIELATIAMSMIREGKKRYSLVMVNTNIPDMHYLSFLRTLRRKNIPVIMMATQRDTSTVVEAINEGASIFLEKPIYLADLKYVWQYMFTSEMDLQRNVQERVGESENPGNESAQGVKIIDAAEPRHGGQQRNIANEKDLDRTNYLRQGASDPKGKGKMIESPVIRKTFVSESQNADGALGNKLMIIGESKKKGDMTNYLRQLVSDPKGKSKIIESPVVHKNFVRESQNANGALGNNLMIIDTSESQKQGGSQLKRKRPDIGEDQEASKTMRASMTILGNSKNTNNNSSLNLISKKEKERIDKENADKRKSHYMVWTPELHHKFAAAVTALGKNARPKTILQLMKVPNLTLLQISSHLQKYKAQMKKKSEKDMANSSAMAPKMSNFNASNQGLSQGPRPWEKFNSAFLRLDNKSSDIAAAGKTQQANLLPDKYYSGISSNELQANKSKFPAADFTPGINHKVNNVVPTVPTPQAASAVPPSISPDNILPTFDCDELLKILEDDPESGFDFLQSEPNTKDMNQSFGFLEPNTKDMNQYCDLFEPNTEDENQYCDWFESSWFEDLRP